MYDPKQRKREDLLRTKLAEGEAAKATLKEIVLHGKGNAQDVLNSLVLEVRTLKERGEQESIEHNRNLKEIQGELALAQEENKRLVKIATGLNDYIIAHQVGSEELMSDVVGRIRGLI